MTSRRSLVALVVLLLLAASIPHPAGAQGGFGGGGGFGGRGGGSMGGRGRDGVGASGDMPGRNREAPAINTAELILKNGHDLALTESQVVRLTAVKARLDSALRQVRARMDSLAPGGRAADGDPGEPPPFDPSVSGPSGDRRGMREQIERRREAMKSYREALDQGRKSAFGVLEKEQRKQTAKLEKALRKKMEDEMPARNGGMGGGVPE